MKAKSIMDNTDSNKVYVRARKRYHDQTGAISCSICPYHHHENAKRKPAHTSWKRKRKFQFHKSN